MQRATDSGDQRASTATATPEGCRLFRKAASGHRRRVRESFLERMTPEQRAVLAEVWRALRD